MCNPRGEVFWHSCSAFSISPSHGDTVITGIYRLITHRIHQVVVELQLISFLIGTLLFNDAEDEAANVPFSSGLKRALKAKL